MSAMIVNDYAHVFDCVQFAIDVKRERKERDLTQLQVCKALGYDTAAVVSMVENAKYDDMLKLRDFVRLCQMFDLHPFDYFDLQRSDTLDYFKILG